MKKKKKHSNSKHTKNTPKKISPSNRTETTNPIISNSNQSSGGSISFKWGNLLEGWSVFFIALFMLCLGVGTILTLLKIDDGLSLLMYTGTTSLFAALLFYVVIDFWGRRYESTSATDIPHPSPQTLSPQIDSVPSDEPIPQRSKYFAPAIGISLALFLIVIIGLGLYSPNHQIQHSDQRIGTYFDNSGHRYILVGKTFTEKCFIADSTQKINLRLRPAGQPVSESNPLNIHVDVYDDALDLKLQEKDFPIVTDEIQSIIIEPLGIDNKTIRLEVRVDRVSVGKVPENQADNVVMGLRYHGYRMENSNGGN